MSGAAPTFPEAPAPARDAGSEIPDSRSRLVTGVAVLASGVALLRALLAGSFDGRWAPVSRALDYTIDPPWRHRVLFVWVANGFRALHPGLSPFRAYFASQIVAVFLALAFVTLWARRFVSWRETWAAPVMVALMLVPTITYRTFHDFGIVATYALALHLMFRRRLWAYVAVLAIGTLNHEITLFLVAMFLLLYFDRAPSRAWLAGWTALQIAVYGAVRLALFLAMPVPGLWQGGKLAYNLSLIAELRPELLIGALTLVFWLLFGVIAWPRVTPMLRRCVWLFPLIAVEVLFVGQLNEPRQFDAFLPVLVAMLMHGMSGEPAAVEIPPPIRRATRTESPPGRR